MNKRTYILLLLVLLKLLSCEEETSWEIAPSEPVVVVDALITSEFASQVIYVYSSSSDLNKDSEGISGANLYITDGHNQFFFTESTDSAGKYISQPFIVVTNEIYTLVIEHEGFIDSAKAQIVPVSPLRDFEFDVDGELFRYQDPGSDLPSMTEVFYDWSNDVSYCDSFGACQAVEVFYTLNTVDLMEEFAPDKQKILFPKETWIYRKKYSLSDQHQEFVRGLLLETEWRGGLFDTEHGNIPTNFVNGARGWFGVCQVLTDSIFFDF